MVRLDHENLFYDRQVTPGFFDLIAIDECHRGSAADDSAATWRATVQKEES